MLYPTTHLLCHKSDNVLNIRFLVSWLSTFSDVLIPLLCIKLNNGAICAYTLYNKEYFQNKV